MAPPNDRLHDPRALVAHCTKPRGPARQWGLMPEASTLGRAFLLARLSWGQAGDEVVPSSAYARRRAIKSAACWRDCQSAVCWGRTRGSCWDRLPRAPRSRCHTPRPPRIVRIRLQPPAWPAHSSHSALRRDDGDARQHVGKALRARDRILHISRACPEFPGGVGRDWRMIVRKHLSRTGKVGRTS